MDKTTLVSLVKKEAANLKRKATKKELNHLDFNELKPTHKNLCIYGQATGDCFSIRAHELIRSCAPKVYVGSLCYLPSCSIHGKLSIDSAGDRGSDQWSPIEIFIGLSTNRINGNNKALINYLKGKTKRLSFKKF